MKLTTVIGLLSFSLAACATDSGSDVPTSSNRPSKQQSASLLVAATSGLGAAKSGALGSQQSLTPAVITLDHTGSCELGGQFDISGTYDYDIDSTASEWDLDTQFSNCAVPEATLDGNLSWSQSVTATGDTLERITGTLSLTAPDGSASCVFDLTIATGASGVSYHGSVCGYDVAADLDAGI